ncbi:MAG TPA: pilus assembly protein TadG-related protein [Acidimicrobiia bacterium]|nr:pilus assembly protein TadG-related protein [Acidimicrobiia bacterium]
MRRLLNKLIGEKGAALPITASMLVVLLGIAGFGTDLGWFYLNASRIQRAADAAALAGVINMPHDFPQAEVDARAAAQTNGYVDGVDDVSIQVAEVPHDPNQLDVTVTDTVDTFFARIFGMETVTISRTARAEFIPPLKLGSPINQFGNSCDPGTGGSSCGPGFWANIHGKLTDRAMGDAFSPACVGSNDNPGCTGNVFHRDDGYLYGIDPAGQSSFTIEFLDIAFHNVSNGNPTSDHIRTGDRGCEDWGNDDAQCGPTMIISLYGPDPDPLNVSNNPHICTVEVPPRPQVPEEDPYNWEILDSCMQNVSAVPGTYVLQIRIKDEGSAQDRSGLNRYAVRSSPDTKLFALRDMSIYNNAEVTTEFHLAEVEDYYAGKTLVVELFDPGEGAQGYLQMIDPRTDAPYTGTCRVYDSNNPNSGWNLIGTPTPCQEHVSVNEYHDRWVKFEMDLPSDYACGTDCWWMVNYAYGGSIPNDTTTWRAYIVGNPIHLVPHS